MTEPLPLIRRAWPDQAKGFGILLVVIGHAWRGLQAAGLLPEGALFQTIDRLIYAFHMPLFFFLSGLFFESTLRRAPLAFLRMRWSQILWPLMLWTWIFFAFKGVAGSLANHPADWQSFPFWPFPPREQFWFFWALFLIQGAAYLALAPLARRGLLSPARLGLAWLCASALVLLPFGPWFPAEWVGPACRYAGHFCLGLLAARWLLSPHRGPGVGLALGLFLASEALALALPATPLGDMLPAIGALAGVVLVFRALEGRRGGGAGAGLARAPRPGFGGDLCRPCALFGGAAHPAGEMRGGVGAAAHGARHGDRCDRAAGACGGAGALRVDGAFRPARPCPEIPPVLTPA